MVVLFCPSMDQLLREFFRVLHAAWHGTKALVYRDDQREAAASTYLAIIFGTDVPTSTPVLMQLSHGC